MLKKKLKETNQPVVMYGLFVFTNKPQSKSTKKLDSNKALKKVYKTMRNFKLTRYLKILGLF